MTIKLKQSTASQEIPLGIFVDETDGKTAETALTINASDIKLWKMGATTLANKNSGGATHISGGIYYAVLDATDTDTLGGLVAFVHVSGALPIRVECEVLVANVYDSLIAASDKLEVDVTQLSSDATAADNAEAFFDGTGYAGTNNVIPIVTTVNGLAANTVNASALAADAVTEMQSGLATAANLSTVAGYIDTEIADIQSRLPAALVSGRMDSSVGAVAAGVDLSTTMKASVNAEVLDVLNVDTFAEPTGAPAATTTLAGKIGRLYQALRNSMTVTSSAKTFKDDAGTNLWSKSLSDDGTTYTEAEGS